MIARVRTTSLILLVVAALLGALSVQDSWFEGDGWPRIWSIGAGLSLGIAGALETLYVTPARTRAWVAARSASERLKAAVWLAMCSVAPYNGSHEERASALFDLINDVEEHAAAKVTRSSEPVDRSPPVLRAEHTGEDYCVKRAEDQRDYHRRAGRAEQTKGSQLRLLIASLTLTGATLGAAGGLFEGVRVAAWVAAFSAATAAVATHAGAARHDQVAASYSATASRLELTIERFRTAPIDSQTTEQLVNDVEQILAIQNDIWSEAVDRG